MQALSIILQALAIASYVLLTVIMIGLATFYLIRERDLVKGPLWLWLAAVEIIVGLLALTTI